MNKDQFAYLNMEIKALEAERDRLKAQLESSDHFFGQACKERDLWKSKYKDYVFQTKHSVNIWKSRAAKLAEALIKIADCEADVCPESKGKYVAKEALAEFEKEGK